MTDLALLKAAAQAAGIQYDPEASNPHPKSGAWWGLWLTFDHEPSEYDRRYWNPLTDDGDALRLAVHLGLLLDLKEYKLVQVIDRHGEYEDATEVCSLGGKLLATVPHRGDPFAATRRAIVRAAAALTPKEAP